MCNRECIVIKVKTQSEHYIFKELKVGTRFRVALCIWTDYLQDENPIHNCLKIVVDNKDDYIINHSEIAELNKFDYEEIIDERN